jgi:serine-type D-Ala-D-Ala carboxypeptidase/endopeptidase
MIPTLLTSLFPFRFPGFIYILMLVCAGLLYPASGLQAQADPDFDAYIEKRMEYSRIPAISIAMIDPSGSITYRNYGYADAAGSEPASENTIYEIGSITKTFTALALLLQLNERGLTGDVTIKALSDGAIELPAGHGTEITVNHMVTHTSGLPRLPGNMAPADMEDPYREFTYDQLYRFIRGYRTEVAPGGQFAYSNLAFMILGDLSGRLDGRDFDVVVRERITIPLGMSSTTRILADSARFANPTNAGLDTKPWNAEHLRGLGELRSTASDMAAYIAAWLGMSDFGRRHRDVMEQGMKPLFERATDRHMATAWFMNTSHADTILHHGGGTGGFRTFIGFSRTTGKGVVVLASSTDDVADIGLHLLNSNYNLSEVDEIVHIPAAQLERLEGYYTSEGMPGFTIISNARGLYGQMDGQPPLPLEAVSDTVFRNRQVQAEMHFAAGGERAETLTLRQFGNVIVFIRSEPKTVERSEITLNSEQLNEYAGKYTSAQTGLVFTFSVDEVTLFATLTGQPGFPVFADAPDSFFYKVVPAELKFSRNDNGEVDGVTLLQSGQEIFFARDVSGSEH